MRPAVFLDRDGTIIEDVPYIRDPEDVRIIPGAAAAIRDLRRNGYACVVVTNQSAIGRGMLTVEGLERVQEEMDRRLALDGAELDDWRFSPAVPLGDDRTVVTDHRRKPGPGMLLESARDLSLDLSRSWMVGDTISDMLAGRNANCRGCILVKTGQHSRADESDPSVDHVVEDLRAAARLILELDGVESAGHRTDPGGEGAR